MVCEGDGTANANRDAVGGWESWEVHVAEDCPKGKVCVAFRSPDHNKWLTVEEDGSANCY